MTSAHQFTCQLKNRGVIRIGGDDRRSFLQGLISNDINLCKPGAPIYAALLTPQGKFLHDMFVVDTGDDFLIDCEMERAEDLLKRLAAYKLRAKVALESAVGGYDVWTIFDPTLSFPRKRESSATPAKAGGTDMSHAAHGHAPLDPRLRGDDKIVFVDPRMPELGLRAILKKGQRPDAPVSDFAAYDKHRIALTVPDGSRDMVPEKSTLLECNIDRLNGISWTKGCYVGQELTARMYHRALVKKRLFTVRIEGAAPASGLPIYLRDEDIGDMRSSCEDVGLALLNIEKAEVAIRDKVALVCGGVRLLLS